jgi:hypothetical protein
VPTSSSVMELRGIITLVIAVVVIAGLCHSCGAAAFKFKKSTPVVVAEKTLARSYHSCGAGSNWAFGSLQSAPSLLSWHSVTVRLLVYVLVIHCMVLSHRGPLIFFFGLPRRHSCCLLSARTIILRSELLCCMISAHSPALRGL